MHNSSISPDLPYRNEIQEILSIASQVIYGLKNQTLDVLDIASPPDLIYARHLAKVVSKLSPLIGNMLEFSMINVLNQQDWSQYHGDWIRQDPDFPDNLFQWEKEIKPGIEVKAWFPLATEITARFKDSEDHFQYDQTNVAVIAWLPEKMIYGKPKIIDVFIDTAKSFAAARNLHYHNPPYYLVFEPEDTSERTRNLQQTNTNGYVFQGTPQERKIAEKLVKTWGPTGKVYSSAPDYQDKLQALLGQYRYRLDTNYSKIDRIEHAGLEQFKQRIRSLVLFDYPISRWGNLFMSDEALLKLLNTKS